ncbi:MAG: DUF4340 domain-containing protein [Clostridia bacterium]|nr:DUF4340 domain-containing protein [Clostridia bacterium]
MQKVERQKHKDRRRGRLTGIILCAVLLAACVTGGLLLFREGKEQKPVPVSTGSVSGTIIKRGEEELESITVTQQGKDPWTVVRDEEGNLRLLTEGNTSSWSVDRIIGRALTDAAVNLTYEEVFSDNPEEWKSESWAFGLDEPMVTAVFRYTDGTEKKASIGYSSDTEGNNAAYYMSIDGDDRLYSVSAGTLEDLNVTLDMLHPVAQPEIRKALLDRITVKNGDGTIRREWALQGKITDRDSAENWILTVPYTYLADYDTIKGFLDTAENFRLGNYVGEADEESLKTYGLDEPASIIEFHMAQGSTGTVSDSGVYDVVDWEDSTVTLVLGAHKTDMISYALYGNEIYTVPDFTLQAFLETETLRTVARYTIATPLTSLKSIVVEKQGEEAVVYTVYKKEAETSEENGEGEKTEDPGYGCLRNGQEISYDMFSAAWDRLLTVTVSGKLPDGYVPGEPHTRYTIHTVSGAVHTVELSELDAMHDAVTMDGYTLFYLIKGGMTALPEAAQ